MSAEPKSITHGQTVIHTEYEAGSPPPQLGPNYSRFIFISDSHNKEFFVPDGDVLIHAGDLTGLGSNAQIKAAARWIREFPHRTKLVIAGNHDLCLDAEWYQKNWQRFHSTWRGVTGKQDSDEARYEFTCQASKDAGLVYLEYESHSFSAKTGGRTYNVFGFPGTPVFGNWAFNYNAGSEAEALVSQIPLDTDILISHGPPAMILDRTIGGDRAGCPTMRERLRDIRPLIHTFGHIHEARGVVVHPWEAPQAGGVSDSSGQTSSETPPPPSTIFINAANQPSGLGARRAAGFGGLGFQPIIVDVWDPPSSS